MQPSLRTPVRSVALALGLALLMAAFAQRAFQNLARIDYRNSNFVFFWMAGRLVALGESPYDAPAWRAQHEMNQVTWRADDIFSYPLPVAIFMAPLGMLPLATAYVSWQVLSQGIIASTVWVVLRRTGARRPGLPFWPLMLGLLYFGPVYLTLQIGGLGGLTLAAAAAALLALEGRRFLLAGMLLSLLLLKPSQGLPILVLAGIWLVFHHHWRALIGTMLGSVALLVIGLTVDPQWPAKFAGSAQGLLTRNLGLHSTVFSMAWQVCGADLACTWLLGGVIALLVGLAALMYLWRRRQVVDDWEALSLIIPFAFLGSLYAWSYDQILYVIPIAWVVGRLIATGRGFLAPAAFALLVVTLSLVALAVHAYTGTDLLSSLTSFAVLVGVLAVRTRTTVASPKDSPTPTTG